MDTLEVSVSRIISRLNKCLKTCLHQRAYAAAEDCLLTEEIRLRLGTEGRLQNASSCAADSQRVCQSLILCLAGSVLMNGYQTGNTLARLILASYRVAWTLGCNHGHVHILRRHDTAKVDIEAMCEHQHVACFQIRFDVLLIHSCLQLIIDENHNDICLLSSLSRRIYLEALCLSLRPGLGALVKADNYVTAGLLRVQSVCMTLAAIADHSDRFAIQKRQITVFLIENFCHFSFLR